MYQAEIDLLRRFSYEGYSTPDVAAGYAQALQAARRAVAGLLHCDPAEVVLTHSTSEGIGIVAHGLSWQPGDEVITSDLEHLSGIAPWRHLARLYGVRVVYLKSEGGHLSAEAYARAMTERTKLICVSHVSWATGTVLPVAEICRAARDAGVLTLIDGAQSAGHLAIDLGAIDCDFYTVSGQKWLLGPEGTGALFVRRRALDRVHPTRIGWSSLADFDPDAEALQYQGDARSFETGTLHAPAFAGLAEAVRLLQGAGCEAVFARAVHLAGLAREQLASLPHVRILSPATTPSGLLTFAVAGADPDACVQRLWREHRIIVRSIPPLGALRASFHAFNTEADVDALVRGVAALN